MSPLSLCSFNIFFFNFIFIIQVKYEYTLLIKTFDIAHKAKAHPRTLFSSALLEKPLGSLLSLYHLLASNNGIDKQGLNNRCLTLSYNKLKRQKIPKLFQLPIKGWLLRFPWPPCHGHQWVRQVLVPKQKGRTEGKSFASGCSVFIIENFFPGSLPAGVSLVTCSSLDQLLAKGQRTTTIRSLGLGPFAPTKSGSSQHSRKGAPMLSGQHHSACHGTTPAPLCLHLCIHVSGQIDTSTVSLCAHRLLALLYQCEHLCASSTPVDSSKGQDNNKA